MKDLKMLLRAYSDQNRRKKMTPPYTCPFCGMDRIVNITKKKREFRVWCQKGCFDKNIILLREAMTKIDAFNMVIDTIRRNRRL